MKAEITRLKSQDRQMVGLPHTMVHPRGHVRMEDQAAGPEDKVVKSKVKMKAMVA